MELNKDNIKKIIFIITAGIVIFMGLQKLTILIGVLKSILSIILPFVVGAAVAFIINVPMRSVENHLFGHYSGKNKKLINKIKRPLSYVVTLLLVCGVLFIVMFMVIPQLADTFKSLYVQIPIFFDNVQKWVNELVKEYAWLEEFIVEVGLTIDWASIGEKVMAFLQEFMGSAVSSTVDVAVSIVSAVTTFVIGFIFSIYLLFQKEKLSGNVKKLMYAYLPEKRVDRILEIAALSNRVFSKFLSGQCLEAVIISCLFLIAMTIFKMPYALLVSVLIGFCALIPVVGAFIGCFVGAFLILLQNPVRAIWFVVMFLVIQQLEGNLIYPKVVGNSVGLPSIWVLVAVTVGGNVMGVAGMLIFIPLISVIYTLLRENVNRRLRMRKISADKVAVKKYKG